MSKTAKAVLAAILVIALVLALFLISPLRGGSDYVERSTLADSCSEPPEDWSHAIAYVPLDDRMDNVDFVVYQAQAAGYRIVMPGSELIHTCLDGQEKNANGTQYGNREELLQWVQEMDSLGCNIFLLSLDQLMSGGLVNSRALSQSLPLEFDIGSMSETEAFDRFILSLGNDPNNRIYLFDSVMRLASTVGYENLDIEEYTAIRSYGKIERPLLTGDELTLNNIFAAYAYSADGKTPAEQLVESDTDRELLTQEIIDDYLSARQRKLSILDHVMTAIGGPDTEGFQLLVGIDDSSNSVNIQTNELAYISQQLKGDSLLIAGVDCLARMLLAGIAVEDYDYGVKVYAEFIGGSEDLPGSEYDNYKLSEVFEQNMKLFGASYADEESAELQFVIMTYPDDESLKEEYCDALVAKLRSNLEKHIPTVFVDASNYSYGIYLENSVMENIDFAQLVGFAGKFSQAVVIGSGFAMGFSRYLYLRCCDDKSPDCDAAQLKQLTLTSELGYAYAIHSRPELNAYISELGCNFNNIVCSDKQMKLINERMCSLMQSYGAAILANVSSGSVLSELDGYVLRPVESVTIHDLYMPWYRAYEITFTIDVLFK